MNFEPNRRQFLLGAGAALAGAALSQVPRLAAETNPPPTPLAPPDRQPDGLILPSDAPKKIGWAIVGLGGLAIGQILPAFAECKLSRPAALVSGHPDKARKLAAYYGLPEDAIYTYENYDKLAQDPRVDAIYIVLPNSMHAEYTIRGLKAGKNVLCEKPMSATVDEARQMVAAAEETHKKLMIAYRLHYEPFNLRVGEYCRKNSFGPVRGFTASNCHTITAPNIRLSRALGGGPVEDVGIYCINAGRTITGEEPNAVSAFATQPDDPRFREVAASVSFLLRYPAGIVGACECSYDAMENTYLRVTCTGGLIDLERAFAYQGQELRIRHGDPTLGENHFSEVLMDPVNHFASEMDYFSNCILSGEEPRTSGAMGLADMKIIAAIAEAARTGGTVPVAS